MNHRHVAALFLSFASLAAATADATVRQAFLTSVAGPTAFSSDDAIDRPPRQPRLDAVPRRPHRGEREVQIATLLPDSGNRRLSTIQSAECPCRRDFR